MKLGCKCGHTIVDQTDNIPYKGSILSDTLSDRVYNTLSNGIDSLMEAKEAGKRMEWIMENFQVPPYPVDLSDASMLNDLLGRELIKDTQDIFECENCGRILIQEKNSDKFRSFVPETNARGILNGE